MNRQSTQDQILRDVLHLLRRQRVLIIASLLIAAGAAIAYAILKTPEYQASAELQFNDQSRDLSALGIPTPPPVDPTQQVAADSQVITSDPVIRRVSRAVDSGLTKSDVRDSVATGVDPATNLVTLQGTAESADLAAKLANEFARQTTIVATRAERARFREAARRLERSTNRKGQGPEARSVARERLSGLLSLASFAQPVSIASKATSPGSPASPKPVRDTFLALFLGLIFGMLAAFLRDSLDRRLTDAHDIQHQLEFPMVGYVEADALGMASISQNGLGLGSDPSVEPFRILRSNVEFLAPERPLRTVAVTSPGAEEGKSTVAAGLAMASALAGKRVLLVECDLRRPVLAERLKLASQPGLTDWLTGNAKPADVIQLTPRDGNVNQEQEADGEAVGSGSVSMVTVVAGNWSSRPADLLSSPRFQQFLDQVGRAYDLVVLDCAPLLPVGDSLEVLPLVDAILVCIRLDQTTREQANAAKAAVEHLPPRPTGVVITGVRPGREGYYYGYYSSTVGRPGVFGSPGARG